MPAVSSRRLEPAARTVARQQRAYPDIDRRHEEWRAAADFTVAAEAVMATGISGLAPARGRLRQRLLF